MKCLDADLTSSFLLQSLNSLLVPKREGTTPMVMHSNQITGTIVFFQNLLQDHHDHVNQSLTR
jgi:hypothetical protein